MRAKDGLDRLRVIAGDLAHDHLVPIKAPPHPLSRHIVSLSLVTSDIVAIILSFATGGLLANAVGMVLDPSKPRPELGIEMTDRLVTYLFVAGLVVLWMGMKGHYHRRLPFWTETGQALRALVAGFIIDGFVQFAMREDFSRLWVGSAWLAAALLLPCMRQLTRWVLRKSGLWRLPIIMVGEGPLARAAHETIQANHGTGYEIVGQLPESALTHVGEALYWRGLCEMRGASGGVMLALEAAVLDRHQEVLADLARQGVPFILVPPYQTMPVINLQPHYFMGQDTLFLVHQDGLADVLALSLKRAFDIMVSGCVLLLFSPLMLLIAALVRLDGGPALYGGLRVGRDGRLFRCLKFRSMELNAEAKLQRFLAENDDIRREWETTWKLREDPRITRVGDFIRKTSLDELPQLINVFRGEMSLVGPRPILPDQAASYGGDIAHYQRVRPGITGLWQISGRNSLTARQRVALDSWYARNWSLWHDLVILLRTLPALLKKGSTC